MNLNDQNDFRKVVAFFWGEANANKVPMTEPAIAAVVDVLAAAGACSNQMDLVPRPHTSFVRPTYKYAIKQIRNIAKNITFGSSGIYTACKNTVALRYRMKIEEIAYGIY